MKLPFLLNSVARASSASDVESVFSKLLKVIPQLEGCQVSNVLNLLSKKDISQPQQSWRRASSLLLCVSGDAERVRGGGLHRGPPVGPGWEEQDSGMGESAPETRKTALYEGEYSTASHNRALSQRVPATCAPSLLSTYDIRDVIIILNAFSKVDVMPPQFMGKVVEIVVGHLNRLDAHELSSMLHTLGKHGLVEEVEAVLRGRQIGIDDCSADERDYSMLMRVLLLNRATLKDTAAFDSLVGILDRKCGSMSDKSLAILVNSLGRYGSDEKGVLPMLVPLIIKRLRSGALDAMCISQIANGVARLHHVDSELMEALARRTCADLAAFSTRCKVTVLNAFHKLDVVSPDLFGAVMRSLSDRHDDMQPQCIANTVAAVAHFNRILPHDGVVALLTSLCRVIQRFRSLAGFTVQNQVNILNGLSKVGVNDSAIFDLFGDNIVRTAPRLKPIDVAVLLNAFARIRRLHPLVTHLTVNVVEHLPGMKPQELSCCTSSINILRKCAANEGDRSDDDRPWIAAMRALADHLRTNPTVIARFRPLDVRLSLVGLADSGLVDRDLYALLLGHLETTIVRASLWDLVSIFSAMVKVDYTVSPTLLDAIEQSFDRIGACKARAKDDARALRLAIGKMGLSHPLTRRLGAFAADPRTES